MRSFVRHGGLRMTVFFAVTGMTALFLSGCKVEPPKPILVETVAVLPFDSESNDIKAPDIMQRLVCLALQPTAYRVKDMDETNKFLEGVGIVDGGQLPAIDPIKLGKDLGVQALLYGNVASFGYTNIGFYAERKVKLELKLVDVANGATLWEAVGSNAKREFTLDKNEASKRLAEGLVSQLVDKIFDTPLEEEARLATIDALKTLPGFQFHGFATDAKTKTPGSRGVRDAIKGAINDR